MISDSYNDRDNVRLCMHKQSCLEILHTAVVDFCLL